MGILLCKAAIDASVSKVSSENDKEKRQTVLVTGWRFVPANREASYYIFLEYTLVHIYNNKGAVITLGFF